MANAGTPDRTQSSETQRVYAVQREDNRILFTERINPQAHGQFMWCLNDCLEKGYEDIVLDLSQCEAAFPNGVLPLIAGVDDLRRGHKDVSVVLPTADYLQRLFLNANWAHLLQPDRYPRSETNHPRHVPARRFRDGNQQHQLVGEALDVLLSGMPALQRDDLSALEWSIDETTDNVLNHAQCDAGGILQVSTFERDRKVTVGVADSGRGILESLRESYPELQYDDDAIYKALEAGVTRHNDYGQGNGLAGALRIATASGGYIEITSGRAQVVCRAGDSSPYRRGPQQRFQGTFVYFEIDLDSELQLSEALAFGGEPHRPIDLVETLYETEDGSAISLRLRDEKVGFGSRMAGRQIRTKCLNLLDAAPDKPLLLDWEDVPLISSSFADELVGKLFAELGPLAFSARIRNIGMRRIVHDLIDKAIMQRAGQTMARSRQHSDSEPGNFSGSSEQP